MLRLAVERKRRGWSLAKVCQLTGIDPGAVSRIERGLYPPYPGWQQRLADAFGMPADELFKPVEESAPRTAAASNA